MRKQICILSENSHCLKVYRFASAPFIIIGGNHPVHPWSWSCCYLWAALLVLLKKTFFRKIHGSVKLRISNGKQLVICSRLRGKLIALVISIGLSEHFLAVIIFTCLCFDLKCFQDQAIKRKIAVWWIIMLGASRQYFAWKGCNCLIAQSQPIRAEYLDQLTNHRPEKWHIPEPSDQSGLLWRAPAPQMSDTIVHHWKNSNYGSRGSRSQCTKVLMRMITSGAGAIRINQSELRIYPIVQSY